EEIEIVSQVSAERLIEELLAVVTQQQVLHHADGRDAGRFRQPSDAVRATRLIVGDIAQREYPPQKLFDRISHGPDLAFLGHQSLPQVRIPHGANLLAQRKVRKL